MDQGLNRHQGLEETIAMFDNEQAYNFLVSEARNREFELKQEDVNLLLEKALENRELDFDSAIGLVNSIGHRTWRFEDGKEFLIERVYRALPYLAQKYPKQVSEIESIIGQEYWVRPEVFLEIAANISSDRNIDRHYVSNLLQSFNYQFAFGGEGYDKAVAKSLDFDDKGSFEKTGKYLDFYRSLFSVAQGESFSEERSENLRHILQGVVQEQKGSYLLLKRAEGLLHDMIQSQDGFINSGYDRRVFSVSPKYKGFRMGEHIMLLPSDGDEIARIYKSIEANDIASMPSEDLLNEARQTGQKWLTYSLPEYIQKERGKLYADLRSLFSKGIKLESVVEIESAKDDDKRDYEFLLNPDTRQTIQKDFGVSLTDLSIALQFEFLNFLKSKNYSEASGVMSFAKTYGVTGIKTFLSLEYGRDFGDDIVKFATAKPEEAKVLFAKYASLIDEIDRVIGEITNDLPIKDGGSKSAVIKKVRDTLSLKGRKLLEDYILGKKQIDVEEIGKLNTDVVAYGALVRSLQGTGITFEQVAGARLDTKQGGTFNADEKALMYHAFTKNREETDPKILLETSVELFEQTLENPEAEFRILYFEDKPVAFVRFEKVGEGEVYAGSLNTAPELKGEYIATKFILNELASKNKESDITAHVWDGRSTTFYEKRCGFEREGEILDWHKTGERFWKLRIPKNKLTQMLESQK